MFMLELIHSGKRQTSTGLEPQSQLDAGGGALSKPVTNSQLN